MPPPYIPAEWRSAGRFAPGAITRRSGGSGSSGGRKASDKWSEQLKGNDRDAYLALKSMFADFGLESLAPKIFDYLKEGYGSDTIALLLQDTPEYKTRFMGNENRRKAGLAVLAPAEYLATEKAYRQILQDAGMPKGFYDSPSDFVNWISGDVSPTEIKGRVDAAVRMSAQANPNTKRALKEMYGVSQNEVAAYFLDRDRAVPLLEKQARASEFAQEALKRNLLDIDRLRMEYFVTAGLSMEQVRGGYAQIAETLPALQAIAGRFGTSFTQHEAEWDVIEPAVTGHETGTNYPKLGGENPTRKRKRLASQERALFRGGRGASSAGLATGYGQT